MKVKWEMAMPGYRTSRTSRTSRTNGKTMFRNGFTHVPQRFCSCSATSLLMFRNEFSGFTQRI